MKRSHKMTAENGVSISPEWHHQHGELLNIWLESGPEWVFHMGILQEKKSRKMNEEATGEKEREGKEICTIASCPAGAAAVALWSTGF